MYGTTILGLYWGFIEIMDKKMEATRVKGLRKAPKPLHQQSRQHNISTELNILDMGSLLGTILGTIPRHKRDPHVGC